jgi:hypothetical protein
MKFPLKKFKEFWLKFHDTLNGFNTSMSRFYDNNDKRNFFNQYKNELVSFLRYGGKKMKVQMTENEIKKVIQKYVPCIDKVSFKKGGAELEIDVLKLQKIQDEERVIYKFRRPTVAPLPSSYSIAPLTVDEKQQYFITIQ